MATRKGSDNRFPLVRLVEAAVDSDPTPAGEIHLRANNSTSLPYVVDDAGNVTHWGVGLHDHTGALDGGDLDAAVIDGYVVFNEESAPGNADSGTVRVYAKADGKLYAKDDAGTEHDLTASGGTPAFVGCRVHHNADQTLTDDADIVLAFNSERYDHSTPFHDTSTNNSRITIPTGLGGKYHIGGTMTVTAHSTAWTGLWIRVNGSTKIAQSRGRIEDGSNAMSLSVSADYALAQGDYVELIGFSNTGSRSALALSNYSPEFWIHFIGA